MLRSQLQNQLANQIATWQGALFFRHSACWSLIYVQSASVASRIALSRENPFPRAYLFQGALLDLFQEHHFSKVNS